jgi:hypothetical protein
MSCAVASHPGRICLRQGGRTVQMRLILRLCRKIKRKIAPSWLPQAKQPWMQPAANLEFVRYLA